MEQDTSQKNTQPDLWFLYEQMLYSRLFEEAVTRLWDQGLISGEMHLGTGEEAIIAGIVTQLRDDDALALDHRGTAGMLMRGVEPVSLLREFLGHPDGLCAGQGGHMHLYSPKHLAASSGIVGAAGPTAAGFALAAQQLRPGTIAVAFFGEGATNQGMLLESFNLAVVWKLPVIFVCKDNGWAITTQTRPMIGGNLIERAQGFGMSALDVDGSDVIAMWQAARQAIDRARSDEGPTFIHVRCIHIEGHFLGYTPLRIVRHPLREMLPITMPLIKAIIRPKGIPLSKRLKNVGVILSLIGKAFKEHTAKPQDPLIQTRQLLEAETRLQALEQNVDQVIQKVVQAALA